MTISKSANLLLLSHCRSTGMTRIRFSLWSPPRSQKNSNLGRQRGARFDVGTICSLQLSAFPTGNSHGRIVQPATKMESLAQHTNRFSPFLLRRLSFRIRACHGSFDLSWLRRPDSAHTSVRYRAKVTRKNHRQAIQLCISSKWESREYSRYENRPEERTRE